MTVHANITMRVAIICMLVAYSAACTPSETNICMTVDLHAGESGYYKLDRGNGFDTSGASPDITLKIGTTYIFDQSYATNWYHAVGFAYYPDGAHGDVWGGAERDEVEGAGELQYKIDGAIPTCAEAGSTGLDCYEPEFFLPRADWKAKKYTAELTITNAVASASKGGVLYYFCHIHSKMSGRIIIKNADGSDYSSTSSPLTLYSPTTNDPFDMKCGTTAVSAFADGGAKQCNMNFFGGDRNTDYEKCLHAIDCQMHWDMYTETTPNSDKIVTFMQQMIPHHQNAVNMAKLLLKQATQPEIEAVDGLEDILHNIINTQNYQVHQFRNYLNGTDVNKLLEDPEIIPPSVSAAVHIAQMYSSVVILLAAALMIH